MRQYGRGRRQTGRGIQEAMAKQLLKRVARKKIAQYKREPKKIVKDVKAVAKLPAKEAVARRKEILYTGLKMGARYLTQDRIEKARKKTLDKLRGLAKTATALPPSTIKRFTETQIRNIVAGKKKHKKVLVDVECQGESKLAVCWTFKNGSPRPVVSGTCRVAISI